MEKKPWVKFVTILCSTCSTPCLWDTKTRYSMQVQFHFLLHVCQKLSHYLVFFLQSLIISFHLKHTPYRTLIWMIPNICQRKTCLKSVGLKVAHAHTLLNGFLGSGVPLSPPYRRAGEVTSRSRCHGHSPSRCGWSPAPPPPAPRPPTRHTFPGGHSERVSGLQCQARIPACCSILCGPTGRVGWRGEEEHSCQVSMDGQTFRAGARAPERGRLTLPPRGAGGLDADLHQHIFCRSFLPAVIGCDSQLVLVLFSIVQLLYVFYVTFQREKQQ